MTSLSALGVLATTVQVYQQAVLAFICRHVKILVIMGDLAMDTQSV